jgi:two-component system alkaline phosphatase synthesis response regulator PhoP
MTKIMLVEDDPTMLSLLTTLLEMEGYTVTKPNDFSAIPTAVKLECPDVMLVDVHLEDISGLDILVEIRADESTKNIPVIMSSGMDFSSECIQKGASDFIMKPYMPDDLIAKIKGLV